jgi:glucose-6-phosphate 1-dehydrogenase
MPPLVFKAKCMATNGWTRVIVEKPFGKDSDSSAKLSTHLAGLFKEDQVRSVLPYFAGSKIAGRQNVNF